MKKEVKEILEKSGWYEGRKINIDEELKDLEDSGLFINEKAKDFILNEINELKSSLEDQGLNVADVKVDIRQDNHETQMQQERQKSSKRIQEILASFDEEEEEMVEPLISSDSEVDYMV